MPKGKGPGAPYGNQNAAGPHKGYHGRTSKNTVTRSLKHVSRWGLRATGSPVHTPPTHFAKSNPVARTKAIQSRTEQVKSILRSSLMGAVHHGKSAWLTPMSLAFRTGDHRAVWGMKVKKAKVVKFSKTYHGRMKLHWSEARKFRNRRRR